VSLFGSFVETIASQLGLHLRARSSSPTPAHPDQRGQPDDLHRAADRWIGGVLVLVARDPGGRRSAGTVVQEVRRQFREHPGIMDYTEKPEYGRVISICTAAAQRELVTPALLAVLTPVIVGFGINYLGPRGLPGRPRSSPAS
jgi:hypothetical protein